MAGLKLESVGKTFGELAVIHSVDLEIDSGEFVVFVGPSGCGKSTLLRLIAGLEDTTSGRIEIDGQNVTETPPSQRGVAMVFQSYALYPHMTVAENMGFGLKINRASKAEIARKVGEAARVLHLEELLDRKPKQLSGGQRQRVAIGRAIVRNPKVFLFDEPLSNLDAELRVQMRLEIARLHRELKTTMIYVTHDQVEAMTLADKIVVLRSGRVEQVGRPIDLYADPDNLFVAGFIGSPKMNFLKAVVGGRTETGIEVRIPAFDLTMTLPIEASLAPGAAVLAGVRPEHFHQAAANMLSLPIDVLENLGGQTYAYGRAPDGDQVIAEARFLPPGWRGATLDIGFDPASVLLFDPDTGLRIR
ncbi:ABC transporter ATP-binding protein [Pleomorphomonas sp. JP5]|uniref:ABC transporter ATP-binding protein n=1 Tax=Pleomorphomonas sp. JP5 TaxID=2942998 RepID=UPI002043CE18|nr:sn-glycerol-3-phosphate ABC transporter ATP-binding protein UgpC [Pleomorphomonas sp. JP5]MCM5558794.1 sn-glycerol-3-phosphate ABC transporter ATP-binding protein UgpC [Pleomorphomonas sp. JP5]